MLRFNSVGTGVRWSWGAVETDSRQSTPLPSRFSKKKKEERSERKDQKDQRDHGPNQQHAKVDHERDRAKECQYAYRILAFT